MCAGWDLDMAWTGSRYGLDGAWDYGIGSGVTGLIAFSVPGLEGRLSACVRWM